ncbi:MAG TPA: DUF6519 domain-containing protein [Kaistia sp.]|nr:DUF6519 domain-containing protein [Kaistia sp.]
MANDFSRVRLDPLLDFAGVELKQGAVMLDADANELTAILDRRLRALASDVLGRSRVSATTPDAFEITLSGAGPVIGKGRLYVDGLLAENHGAVSPAAADRIFDPLMGEPQFAGPIAYAAQPYFPAPPALPTAGRHLVYLDVWNREVTHLERPELVESAIGVETTSRLQTVWQVRVTADVGTDTTCATPDEAVPGWDDIIAPSTGVLTTGTFEVAPVDDPCELPPTGGYRGLENQLYRVEVHDGGQPGAGATFKWSRENASVGSRVASMISATELQLETLGRDDVLSIKTGDWVEIIDDAREFAQASGEMRKVTVDPDTRRLQFAPALPAAMLPGSFPNNEFPDARNLRVRRWDQARRIFRTGPNGTTVEVQDLDAAGSAGVIAIPDANTTLLLENGVTVRFASTGERGFKPGDYWVFAARTADASVEILDAAPPRGIHHHYARLGIWDVGAATVTDCRNDWPPEGGDGHDCSCTACVTEASHADGSFTIQDGVNRAAETGGTVCIGPGQFPLREPVRLSGVRSVLVKGQGPATVLASASGAFLIQNSIAVGVEDLAVLSVGNRPTITVQSAARLSLRNLIVVALDVTGDSRSSAIALEGALIEAAIHDNIVFSEIGVLANDPTAPRNQDAQEPMLLAAALSIRDNLLLCSQRAIALDGRVLHMFATAITGNHALASTVAAISALGVGLAGSQMSIAGNFISAPGAGIRSSCEGLWITDNKLRNGVDNSDTAGIAIERGLARAGTAMAQILANQIDGYGEAGIRVSAPVRDLIIKLNIIAACGNGILAIGHSDGGAMSIENNHLRDIDMRQRGEGGTVSGISVVRAPSANIAGNTLRAVGTLSETARLRTGVLTVGVERARVRDNEAIAIGPTGDALGRTGGIVFSAPLREFEVQHNRIERDARILNQEGGGDWVALLIRDGGEVSSTVGTFTTVNLQNGRALVLGAAGEAFVADLAVADDRRPSGSVLGNTFISRGNQLAVEISAHHCLFGGNRVEARLNQKEAVALRAQTAVVSNNHVDGGEASIRLEAKVATVVGNITSGVITNVPGPFVPLNLRF